MAGFIIALIVIVALMFVVACTLYEWNGIWIIEGILSGLGFWVGDEIWARIKKKKK